ncbi:hypothetical protein RFI_32643 [Reticulomyxa filosa]|uniref:Transmembrane protein n=1 Tax=Reticulomyxa filosa TaxID=46433 RepID=X6LUD5_RETFI|nr:hypothetical protein RFI_32643 [Reticulomyxa filosa]|eukprot:ETO04752.1 hypothetical protein RFI_32643 [Reticulomyxa filosa]
MDNELLLNGKRLHDDNSDENEDIVPSMVLSVGSQLKAPTNNINSFSEGGFLTDSIRENMNEIDLKREILAGFEKHHEVFIKGATMKPSITNPNDIDENDTMDESDIQSSIKFNLLTNSLMSAKSEKSSVTPSVFLQPAKTDNQLTSPRPSISRSSRNRNKMMCLCVVVFAIACSSFATFLYNQSNSIETLFVSSFLLNFIFTCSSFFLSVDLRQQTKFIHSHLYLLKKKTLHIFFPQRACKKKMENNSSNFPKWPIS